MKKSLLPNDAARSAKVEMSTVVAIAGGGVVAILAMVSLSLSSSVGDLGKQVAKLNDRIAELEQRPAKFVAIRPEVADKPGETEKRVLGAQGTLQGEELQRLAGIVRDSGLDQAAVSPEMLKDMAQRYETQKKVTAYREQLVKRNSELHQADEARYGKRVTALFEQAKGRAGGGPGAPGAAAQADPQADAALQTLLEQYPQSNATGIAIAQRAMDAARQGNLNDVEAYYNTLSQNGNFAGVVTDRGVEAVPAMQLYLAQNYLKQNRVSDAQGLLQSVEQNYPDSAIPTPGPGGQLNWQPVSTITQGIRQQIQTGTKAPPPLPPK